MQPYRAVTNFYFEDLKIVCTIGEGTFGRVKLVQHGPTGKVCALKCLDKTHIDESHQDMNVITERDLLHACQDCHLILTLLQTFNQPNQLFMLMEFIQGGELWTYMYEKKEGCYARNPLGGLAMPAVKFIASNVVLAFKYMHDRSIAYRDLKPENLLLDSRGYIKVVDLGFAKRIPYMQGAKRMEKTFTLCGTPEYLAPEIVMSKGYDKSVDIWALGVLLYELYTNKTPFQADYTTKIFQNIVMAGKTLAFPPRMDPHHVSIIRKMLQMNPAFRVGNLAGGIGDIMKEPFFSAMNWEAIEERTEDAPYVPTIIDDLDAANFDSYDEDVEPDVFRGDQSKYKNF